MVALTMAACQSSADHSQDNSDSSETTKNETLVEDRVLWTCEMLGMYAHSGNASVSHNLNINDKGELVDGTITVDMTTLAVTDKNFDASKNQTPGKLIEHLNSEDFFDVKQFPYATFEITTINRKNGKASGELTIKGVSRTETVRIKIDSEANIYKGKLQIDRTKYGITWSNPVKEMVLSNDIFITVEFTI
jgi:polyisoprenoid-binding protein YceI